MIDRFLAPPRDDPVCAAAATPSFSVVIPAYQVAEFIGEAISSVLEQNVQPKEIIVCDDGSTDAIDDALAPYRHAIAVVRQENRGLPAAKNAAVALATGDFISVLDADDAYLPDRLSALGALAATRPDLDILATDVFIESAGRTIGQFYDLGPFVCADQRSEILKRNFIWSGSAVRRDRLLHVGGFDESIDCADDWDCWLRLVFDGSKIGCVNEPLGRYRLRPGAMTERRSRDFAGRLQVLERALQRQEMSREERSVAQETVAQLRPRLSLARAREAIVNGDSDSRRLAWLVARDRSFGIRTRARAAISAVLPTYARRSLSSSGSSDPRVEAWRP